MTKRPQLPAGTLQDLMLRQQAQNLFETTFLSTKEIADRLGIKARTTIVRWQQRYGWERPTDQVIARRVLSTGPVDTTLLPQPPVTQRSQETCHGPASDFNDMRSGDVSSTHRRHSVDTPDDTKSAPPNPEQETWGEQNVDSRDLVSVDALQEADEIERSYSVQELAAVHAMATKAQLRASGKLAATAHGILENLETLMTATERDADVGLALSRLTRINPDRETLAGLAKAVTTMLESAVTMQRTALGMRNEVPEKNGAVPPAPGVGPMQGQSLALQSVIQELGEETLLQMKSIAKRISTSRPQPPVTIDGTASTLPTKETPA